HLGDIARHRTKLPKRPFRRNDRNVLGTRAVSFRVPMNYRHAFHAGNFADLVKHAALLLMLRELGGGEPLTVIDTHGGAGAYSLNGDWARKSGAAAAGVVRLMAADAVPEALALLQRAVRRFNRHGPLKAYPGSPLLAAEALRKTDRLI